MRSSFQVYEQKREKERKLDQRDSQLFKMREVNNSLRDLARNKQLDQREKLKSSLDTTQDMLSAREDEVKASTRMIERVGSMQVIVVGSCLKNRSWD